MLSLVLGKFLYILAAVDLVFWIWAMATGHSMGGLAHILLFNTIFAAGIQFMLDRRATRAEVVALDERWEGRRAA